MPGQANSGGLRRKSAHRAGTSRAPRGSGGIAPELRARIFDPFFTTKPNGTGLGLTTAREAAVELGGDLRLDETPGTGARFVLTLPAGGAAAPQGGAAP